jgi:mannose-6-phosphate isomerase-like protein (cupin superfamily)
MQGARTHVDAVPWVEAPGSAWTCVRWKPLLGEAAGPAAPEFVLRLVEVQAGGRVPFHAHRQAEVGYVVSGRARVRTGRGEAEAGETACLYHAPRSRHALEAVGREPLRYLQAFACERAVAPVERSDGAEGLPADAAVDGVTGVEEAVAWRVVEPSKGTRIRVKRLLDHGVELMAGICEFDPGVHYTRHYHDQPELYFILAGSGIVFTGAGEVPVRPGSALYLGKREVHGLDSLGDEPLKLYWAYGCETAGHHINWTPVEPVYEHARSRGGLP